MVSLLCAGMVLQYKPIDIFGIVVPIEWELNMACCIVGAIILSFLLAPFRQMKNWVTSHNGAEQTVDLVQDAVHWRPVK